VVFELYFNESEKERERERKKERGVVKIGGG